MSAPFTGVNALHQYDIESTFNGTTESDPKVWGKNVSVDTFEFTNNAQEVYDLGSRLPTDVVEQQFEGSFSVSFILGNWNWLELFNNVDDGANGTADILESGATSIAGDTRPPSFEMFVQRKEASNTEARVAKGCIATSFEISADVDGTVEVSIDGVYADESYESISPTDVDDVTEATNYADVTFDPGTSDSVTFDCPRGVTISVENNLSLIRCLGARPADDYAVGNMSASLDVTHVVKVDESDSLAHAYGTDGATEVQSTVTDDETISVQFANGAGGDGANDATFNFTGMIDSYSESGLSAEEEVVEADLSGIITDLTIDVADAGTIQ